MKCVLKTYISHAREALNWKFAMKLMQTIDISHALGALECEARYEMRAKN